jgi:hypothetical protein
MLEFSLSDVGLETVGEASARKGWSPKTIQNWINAGLLAACRVGSSRGTLLLKTADVDAFIPPSREDGRGRPLTVRKTRKPKHAKPNGDPPKPTVPLPAATPGRGSRKRKQ